MYIAVILNFAILQKKTCKTMSATKVLLFDNYQTHFVASELKDPICHSNECQIGSFSSEATICEVGLHVTKIWHHSIFFSNLSRFPWIPWIMTTLYSNMKTILPLMYQLYILPKDNHALTQSVANDYLHFN